MTILKNALTIIAEIIILALSFVWFMRTQEEEPIIVAIGSFVFLVISLFSRFYEKKPRPKIVFHRQNDFYARFDLGITANNPEVIHYGYDKLERNWELTWSYVLEIRNNSSITAYNYEINFKNKPDRTEIEGDEIGKIQPISPEDKFEFSFRLIKNITGTYIDADNYLKENKETILRDMKIIATYTDEHDKKFKTEYNWFTDTNEFKKNSTLHILRSKFFK